MTAENGRTGLPPNWRMVTFGEAVRNVDEYERAPLEAGLERYVGLDHLDPGSLHIRRWGLIAEGTSFTRRFRTGQVLFAKRRAYQRKAAAAEFDGICSGDLLVFEVRSETMVPEILPFLVQSDAFFAHALQTSAGSLSPRTRWSNLTTYEFALPPKEEQRRMAELLWALEENYRTTEHCVANATMLAKSLFVHLLKDGTGAADRYCQHGPWEEVSLGDLLLASPQSGYSAVGAVTDTGHYVLTLTALGMNGYQRGYMKPVHLRPEVEGTRLKAGDFLVSRSNTIDLVGLAGIFDEERNDISFPDTMMKLALDESRIDKRFLQEVMLSDMGRKHIKMVAAGTSDSMKKINRRGLASLRFPLPPLEEQGRILAHLAVANTARQAAAARLEATKSLQTYILRLWFQGESGAFKEGSAADISAFTTIAADSPQR
ncbi:MAG: restriction endonuclease subunit S [Dehalococcoidia bacterium]